MSTEWKKLTLEVENLYNAGKYDQAISVAEKALNVAEKNMGPNHPDVTNSLYNLA
jgi:tetratricopeptide (TPR) repeat protein